MLLDIGGLQILIFCDSIEAGAVLVDVGQVVMTEDPGIGVRGLQLLTMIVFHVFQVFEKFHKIKFIFT